MLSHLSPELSHHIAEMHLARVFIILALFLLCVHESSRDRLQVDIWIFGLQLLGKYPDYVRHRCPEDRMVACDTENLVSTQRALSNAPK